MLSLDQQRALDTSDHTTLGFQGAEMGDETTTEDQGLGDEFGPLSPDDWLQLAQKADSQGKTYFQTAVRPLWARNYRAFRAQHYADSKYLHKSYLGRSKLFRPKTRDAVRKKQQSAAQALFATGDVVSVTAQNQADDGQAVSAALKQELLNYRLSRESRRNGVRWFATAMGAHQVAQILGVCISKQTWRFKEEAPKGKPELEQVADDQELPEEEKTVDQEYQQPRITEDRPHIELIPPEQVIFDPNCDWTNPAQSAQYVRIAWPMAADEAFEFCRNKGVGTRLKFKDDLTIAKFRSAVADNTGPQDTLSTRAARNDGRDPFLLVNGAFGRVWLYEWYMRYRGEDYTFWTLSTTDMLSEPVLVADAYPEQHGERPICIGYGALEAFRATPTSPVESWAPLQMELNDQVNLRLDHLKQTVAPPTKVKRGAQVDLDAVQKRGADRIIMLNNMSDLEWAQIPDIPASAQAQDAQLNSDFDSLAGTMNMGTVQTNRALNETVGGMSLLAGDASQMAEFDLTVWVESWVDPVMNQLIRLEEMYESDATILALAGERAKLYQRFGVSVITDQMLLAETTVAVKVGTGSANLPMQRLQKFQAAASIVGGVLEPYVAAGIIRPPVPNVKEIIETVFGAAGFSDGGDRFFMNLQPNMAAPPGQQKPDPHGQAAQAGAQAKIQAAQITAQTQQQKIAADMKKHQDDQQVQLADLAQRRYETQQRAQTDQDAIHADLLKTHMKAAGDHARAIMGLAHDRGMQAEQHQHDASQNLLQQAAQRAERQALQKSIATNENPTEQMPSGPGFDVGQ